MNILVKVVLLSFLREDLVTTRKREHLMHYVIKFVLFQRPSLCYVLGLLGSDEVTYGYLRFGRLNLCLPLSRDFFASVLRFDFALSENGSPSSKLDAINTFRNFF
jgi:hypothetical protein